MTKKRKVNYAELLRGQQADAPAAPAAPPTPMPSAATPTAATPAPPEAVQPPDAADAAEAPAEPKEPKRARAPRRRAADRATSPVNLASALNERAAFERTRAATPASGVDSTELAALGARHSATELPGPSSASNAPEAAAERRAPSDESVSPAERPSSALAAITGDTMEFAVTSVVNAIPFRERVRARTGRAELLLFRIGRELFATALSAVEEAVELAEVRPIPEMSREMLGVFDLRGRMIPIYTPSITLGVPLAATPQAALVVKAGERRMALAVDDVEDVLDADLSAVRAAPGIDDGDGVLLGVVRHGRSLVAVLDGEALVNACLSDRVPETA